MAPDGMVSIASSHGPQETLERLVAAVTKRGAAILGRVDHAGAAAKVGMALRPTEVIFFGNPKAGTPLMQAVQTMGIDLPLRALVWLDEQGKTWLGYNDPRWLARRHGAEAGTDQVLAAMTAMLEAVAKEATETP